MTEQLDWGYALQLTQKPDDSVVGRLLQGAYDMHVPAAIICPQTRYGNWRMPFITAVCTTRPSMRIRTT